MNLEKTKITPFHIALAVRDIPEAKDFYINVLGCGIGRSANEWVDFNLFGHQFVCHLDVSMGKAGKMKHLINPVDGHGVPIPHSGVVLEMQDWSDLAKKVTGKVEFIISPTVRFEGQVGEQATMFFCDPSGNALEFKGFKNIQESLFAY